MGIRRDEFGRLVVNKRPKPKGVRRPSEKREDGVPTTRPIEDRPLGGRESAGVDGRADVHGPLAEWMCGAKLKNRPGELCRKARLKFSKRCKLHGSGTKDSRIAAMRRFVQAADPLAAEWLRIALNRKESTANRLRAMEGIYDRVPGLNRRDTLDLVGLGIESPKLAPYEQAALNAQVRVVRVRVHDDGTEEVIQGDRPAGITRVHRRPSAPQDAEPLALEPGVIDAEVVSDEPTPDNVVPIIQATRPHPAMLSQLDLQDGRPGERPRPRGRGTTPSEFRP